MASDAVASRRAISTDCWADSFDSRAALLACQAATAARTAATAVPAALSQSVMSGATAPQPPSRSSPCRLAPRGREDIAGRGSVGLSAAKARPKAPPKWLGLWRDVGSLLVGLMR